MQDRHFWLLAILSIIFVLGFFAFIRWMLITYCPDAQSAHQIFDTLSNITLSVLAYWFGSSHPQNR
jgi:hypothetical protein